MESGNCFPIFCKVDEKGKREREFLSRLSSKFVVLICNYETWGACRRKKQINKKG